jgi:inhibitor of KinA
MSYHTYPSGDHAITIEMGDRIDAGINQQVIALFQYLQSLKMGGIKDIIPAYHTLTVVYDPLLLKRTSTATTVYQNMEEWLLKHAATHAIAQSHTRQIEIPVCYDAAFGLDTAFIAESHGISVEEVIQLHTARTYRVYLIGFLPGFAYMGTTDERIATARKSSPRVSVAAGSVGIAGEQTGIYPFDSPGGWQLIGRTPLQMFNPNDPTPCLLNPGDEVKFYPIDTATFHQLNNHGHPRS